MKIFAENKKAYFNYEILEKFEAGMSLIGQEVKSIRMNRLNLTGAYVVIDKNSEANLVGANIPAYQLKNAPSDYDPQRSRKLLLKKKEIQYLIGKSREKGLTLIPLRVYTNNGKIKLEFGIAKGKKQYDKREKTKKRELDREIQKALREKI